MDQSPRSRRSVLGMGAALAAGVLAACGRDTRAPAAPPSGSAAVPHSTRTGRLSPPREIVAGPRDRPQVALTFHGSGDPALAVALLDALRQGRARVTVLAVGRWLDAHPELAGLITGAGHELGNHTYTHPTLTELGETAVRTEIERCRDALTARTGTPGRWFRPSGTPHATPLIERVAAAAGYPTCLAYDVDSLDYTDPGAAAVRAAVAARVRPGSIVSLHFGHRGTVAAMPDILADLRARGLSAVTVSALVGAR
jgi:peptidoglycan/xylan/chitin deacetylase (PgdA/CDA1 family)